MRSVFAISAIDASAVRPSSSNFPTASRLLPSPRSRNFSAALPRSASTPAAPMAASAMRRALPCSVTSANSASSRPMAIPASSSSPVCVKGHDPRLRAPNRLVQCPAIRLDDAAEPASRGKSGCRQASCQRNPNMTPFSATARANANDADPAVAGVERPTPAGVNAPGFGSDVIADALRALDTPYIALTPGASYRGLHDSIVNYLGNTKPQMLLCLHEEAAVAIAHGYAKVTGKAMVTAVHSNVGLMHATMAMFNAWCDRMPVVVLGATGPVDAVKRRPWIDWIHTARDQGALVRDYTKWDDQ